ncbi:TIGR00282 family metallophosphoesterase [Streptomyces sp. NPDC000151]|uniref:TIGR00282 family metallophosphoesterase n=1 Tax=Streptomyces sp. NPDC000151 TaxID=3154244 RepID=UPI00332FD53E
MIVLFCGDVVGEPATERLSESLPELRQRHRVDLVVVNAENSAPNGLGMGAKQVDRLLEAGADVITGGNHSWDSEESVGLLDLPQVVRPANLAPGVPGRGVLHVTAAGETVTVVNLADHCAMKSVKATAGKFLPAYEGWRAADKRGAVIVDYHGDHVLEKQIFAHAVDGEAAAVLGSHTHEATGPLHLLPGGTAFVTEVGMTGPGDGVQGFAPANLVSGLRETGNPFSGAMPSVSPGPLVLGAVVLEIRHGRAVRLERVSWPEDDAAHAPRTRLGDKGAAA